MKRSQRRGTPLRSALRVVSSLSLGFCMANTPTTAQVAGAPVAQPRAIALQVLEPAERSGVVNDFPVSIGLVFPDGELLSVPGGKLVDDRGESVPFDAEATGWWNPDRTRVKWLLLKFRADSDRHYSFIPGPRGAQRELAPFAQRGQDGAIVVDTGPLRAVLRQGSGQLFDSVSLNGVSLIRPEACPQTLTLTGSDRSTEIHDWRAEIEHATPDRVTVRARGFYVNADSDRIAELDLRYLFYRNESFVRIYHTLVWMIRGPRIGARDVAVGLTPALGDGGTARVGLSDYTADAVRVRRTAGLDLYAHQLEPNRFVIANGSEPVHEGVHLGGWIAIEDGAGRGIGVALREAWQLYPTAFAAVDSGLRIEFWPARGETMGFEPQDIMPPDFYHGEHWNRYKWIEDEGHFVHEYSKHPHFEHTPEGAARTHEMTVFFYDNTSARRMADLNSLTQHPLVVRQDPESAMRVPFMGF